MKFYARFFSITVLLITALLTGCSSLPPSRSESSIGRIMDLLNKGNSSALSSLSHLPFLLDSELLVTDSDVDTFWQSLAKSGFRMDFYTVAEILPLEGDSLQRTARSWEEETFFSEYLPRDASLVRIRENNREIDLLLGNSKGGFPIIYGFRGPLQ